MALLAGLLVGLCLVASAKACMCAGSLIRRLCSADYVISGTVTAVSDPIGSPWHYDPANGYNHTFEIQTVHKAPVLRMANPVIIQTGYVCTRVLEVGQFYVLGGAYILSTGVYEIGLCDYVQRQMTDDVNVLNTAMCDIILSTPIRRW